MRLSKRKSKQNRKERSTPAKGHSFHKKKAAEEQLLVPFHLEKRDRRGRLWRRLEGLLLKAGWYTDVDILHIWMLRVTTTALGLATMLLLYMFIFQWDYLVTYWILVIAALWLIGYPLLWLGSWAFVYLILEVRAYNRGRRIEQVLPDFFQIASANIRAGMTVDKALWYAVRPRFGVLAKEIEIVAKESISGKPLESALKEFGERYESKVLKRSISLLVEGIRSGGEIGDLLYKVSLNIQESQAMKRDMAANVSAYTIFIVFGGVVAAPVLLALSGQMLLVILKIFSKISIPEGVSSPFPFSTEESGLSYKNYSVFAIVMLSFTSMFSAMIVSTVKKGDVRSGVTLIPIFIGCAVGIFLLASKILAVLFGEMF